MQDNMKSVSEQILDLLDVTKNSITVRQIVVCLDAPSHLVHMSLAELISDGQVVLRWDRGEKLVSKAEENVSYLDFNFN